MKRNLGPTTSLVTVFAVFVLSMPSAHANGCSMASAAGTYGFTATGTLLLPTGAVPIAAVGKATFHADGSFSGTEARSVGGQFANETLGPGTWTINPDCTGTLTSPVFVSGTLVRTSVLSVVWDDNMREGRLVQQSLTVPHDGASVPAVITFEARRMFTSDQQD